jgi:hypothetical protein
MTNEDRVQAIRELEYAAREAEFLCLAALHSGCFLRRQYCEFIDSYSGSFDNSLTQKIVSKGHAREIPTNQRILLYHICSRSFYAAMEEEGSRHRRCRPKFTIRAKLIALAYLVMHPANYFSIEAEKLDSPVVAGGLT